MKCIKVELIRDVKNLPMDAEKLMKPEEAMLVIDLAKVKNPLVPLTVLTCGRNLLAITPVENIAQASQCLALFEKLMSLDDNIEILELEDNEHKILIDVLEKIGPAVFHVSAAKVLRAFNNFVEE